MGVYDEVSRRGIQVKSTKNPTLKRIDVGDTIDLLDGLHIGREGWFIVNNGKVLIAGKNAYDKWGNVLECEKIIERDYEK